MIQDQKDDGNRNKDFEKSSGDHFLPFLERMNNIGSNIRNTIGL
jgi:hypothetical protein